MSHPDTAAKELRATLAQQLLDIGALRSPEWRSAVEAVPRHLLVPIFYRQVNGVWRTVHSEDPGYFETIYGNTSLTTQVTDGAATSSSSQPSLMLEMLEGLDVEDGDRVGEVATGTGYNAGLISHRVGDANVITLEVDTELSRLAKARLADCGYTPTVVAGDAYKGFPGNPDLDRVIVTCGFDRFPYAVASGVREGGIIVCPLGWGNTRLTKGKDGTLEGRFLPKGSYFMKARQEGEAGMVPYPQHEGQVVERSSVLDHTLVQDEVFQFAQSLTLGEFGSAAEIDADGEPTGYRVWTRDGSWAAVSDGKVRQAGPHRLWDSIEAAYAWFESHERPSRDRFGATITQQDQRFWLDEPGQAIPGLVTSKG